ncbi:hypothetical protein EJB05_46186, partial [Eragrostis curvula]
MGCLLVSPPGTGKTLLARAVAGEAGVPFFSCAASEFVELVGASRVRDLFQKAKATSLAMRGSRLLTGQLLTDRDGRIRRQQRPDVLDSALLRPGRFYRQVTVDRPDVAGRVRILEM